MINFTDADAGDTFLASLVAGGADYLGAFTLNTSGIASGVVSWNYSVLDTTIGFLGEGQTRVQTYDVTISDDHGGSVVQPVTITIVGVKK